jgi:hypothetical protein
MGKVSIQPLDQIATSFFPQEYLPEGKDLFYYVNRKDGKRKCRSLTSEELDILVKNNNHAEDWNNILVTDSFNPELVKNCEFMGRITIGDLTPMYLHYNELKLPVGIANSTIISCDIGDNVAIRDVHYLAHYIVENNVMLFNIDEMTTTNHAKFGNGIIKQGEEENVRIWLEICNENGGRKILPFDSMIPADAWLWSRYRDDDELMLSLKEITDASYDSSRGYYGQIGSGTVLKNSRIIKDVKIGSHAYIKGANKLKNLTIHSSEEEQTQIGEGVELVNGIVGHGTKIFYGSKAVRFVTGRNTQLKYGARLINSVLGDNSTVSCCELLNNLIFPFHEQHHNNSFLISTTVLGQSNIAAGATIGSNHNSRSPDGEIIAGRGFWPGLCTDFKHNCQFASYTLVAKGSYQYEINNVYPFALVTRGPGDESIRIMPAYWFMYNMYALARNSWKFSRRDHRKKIIQQVETSYLAPDTVNEIISAMQRIALLTGLQASGRSATDIIHLTPSEISDLTAAGRELLENESLTETTLHDPMAMKKYGAVIIKPARAWNLYLDFITWYVVDTVLSSDPGKSCSTISDFNNVIKDIFQMPLLQKWVNLGGQLMPMETLESIKSAIKDDKVYNWDDIHALYQDAWLEYSGHKLRHALYAMEQIHQTVISTSDNDQWKTWIERAARTAGYISRQAYTSREKDYKDPWRKITFENEAEMKAVTGSLDDNTFLKDLKIEMDKFINHAQKLTGSNN